MAKDVKINIVAKDKGSAVVKKFSSNTTSALKKLAGPLALGAVAAGFTKLFNDTVKLGDKFDKLNKKLGVSVETLSKLKHIANLNGVAFSTVTGSLERMQRRIGLATEGLGAANKAFERLNIDVEALAKLNPQEQFLRLAEATMRVENPVKRAAVQFEIFGMQGAELAKMLPGLRKELGKTAASITTQQAEDFAEYQDNMAKLGQTLETMKVTVFGSIAKGINAVADSIKNMNKQLATGSDIIGEGAGLLGLGDNPWAQFMQGLYGVGKDDESFKFAPGKTTAAQQTALDKFKVDKDKDKDTTSLEGMVISRESIKFEALLKGYQKRQELKEKEAADDIQRMHDFAAVDEEMSKEGADKATEILDEQAKKAKEILDKQTEDRRTAIQKWSEELTTFSDIAMSASESFSSGLANAIVEADTSFSDFAKNFLKQIAKMIIQTQILNAIKSSGFGGLLGSANGNVFDQSGVKAFAKGGIVNQPTIFPFANGTGLMGEAGPEAILPLTRGPSGKLGVESNGGGQQPQIVNYNIMAMDSKSFVDFVRQNPTAVTTVMNEQMERGNSALNTNIRRVAS